VKKIPTPDYSFTGMTIPLGGRTYTLNYRYNRRSDRWKLDIVDNDEDYLVKGLTLVEDFSPDLHHRNVLSDGFLYVLPTTDEVQRCGRKTLGIGRDLTLVYVPFEE